MENNLNSDQMLDITDDYQQQYLQMKQLLQNLNSTLDAMEEKANEMNVAVSLMALDLTQSLESVDTIAAADQSSRVAKEPTVIDKAEGPEHGITANDDCDDKKITSSQGIGDIETSQKYHEVEKEWLKNKEIFDHLEAIDAKTQDSAQSIRSIDAIAATDEAEQVVTESVRMDDKAEEDINVEKEEDTEVIEILSPKTSHSENKQ